MRNAGRSSGLLGLEREATACPRSAVGPPPRGRRACVSLSPQRDPRSGHLSSDLFHSGAAPSPRRSPCNYSRGPRSRGERPCQFLSCHTSPVRVGSVGHLAHARPRFISPSGGDAADTEPASAGEANYAAKRG
ncbi:hypothetical protein SKAU_G00086060 [Synaphobranchus kaupii]|uniref:Uncharacterized protein n=1 Tax=Synaphobranchus kaupii TaxID=118154 RepID=A0A9Q1FWL3_SYNKA|nr:hypothetical protein SKAU_G00086060 [Synaphobranchus kaupii]